MFIHVYILDIHIYPLVLLNTLLGPVFLGTRLTHSKTTNAGGAANNSGYEASAALQAPKSESASPGRVG